ncbi:threonine/homoserine/homoserine lactone efflux protein [Breoghania corrubedonensis]|uniref:Threonine/homoserine/homoserine lactone efflux protein n=1 Tax=Breoghania corrubedonensis TaxID=665038 RepID=A0A2T5VFY0_9HYPH|nr:LysE family translocator [Breoghania corrubedonensis]PTW62663.1 threonine/homoserine/homoserine lactone efflux protein [Breoghania corrubedonensis]
MQDLLGFVFAGLALTGSPGPNTLSLAAVGAAYGFRRGILYMAGLFVGMLIVMAVIATGVGGLMLTVPGVAPLVTALAAVYFLYLAFKIATAPPIDAPDRERRAPSFQGGVFLSLVNPKAYAAMAALFSGFQLFSASTELDLTAKIIALGAIIALVNALWLSAGSALTALFRDPTASRAINIGFAVLLLASLAFAVLI